MIKICVFVIGANKLCQCITAPCNRLSFTILKRMSQTGNRLHKQEIKLFASSKVANFGSLFNFAKKCHTCNQTRDQAVLTLEAEKLFTVLQNELYD